MRIALCLTSQPRSFKKGFDFIHKNLLSVYNVDVFLHTWFYSFFDYNSLFKLYNPKKVKIDQPLVTNLNKDVRYSKHNVYSLYYSAYECGNLVKQYEEQNDFQYDWIIKTRYDFALNVVFGFENLDNKKVYVPPSMSNECCNDQFAFSSSDNMQKYFSAYKRIEKLKCLDDTIPPAEIVITNTLKEYDLWDSIELLDMNDPFPPCGLNATSHSLIRDDFKFWSEIK